MSPVASNTFSSYLQPGLRFTPPVIAHRGARSFAPENTMKAFRRACEEGATWIETDVKLTSDGVPVLFHDETLDRTTDGHGKIADITWTDLQKLDAGSWFSPAGIDIRVPSLVEVLRFILEKNMHINLELKPCPGRTQATVMVTLIETAKIWPEERQPPLISSFDIEALAMASRLHPEWPRGLLLDGWRDDWNDCVNATGASAVHLDDASLTQERVAAITDKRLPVLVYTVNDPARARQLLGWGVAAVFSDNPQDIIKAL